MTILIFDENLMWSARLKLGVEGLGHKAVIFEKLPSAEVSGDIAIVNLGSRSMPPTQLIPWLTVLGIKTVAHAGHKEKPLLLIGSESGADVVVTNSELTHKLAEVLSKIA